MARVLVVGCGSRGRELAGALAVRGHSVRGTTRDAERLGAIEAAGVEAVRADPDRLGTLLPHLHGISVLVWLMGTARGDPESVRALHGPRLESMLETLVDTPVRGAVYEGAGTVPAPQLVEGAEVVRRVAATYRMPIEVVAADPADRPAWIEAMAGAVDRVLAA